MDVGKFIYAWLLQESDVTDLVGSGSAARIYPILAPQGKAFPRITYQVIDSPGTQQLDGPAGIYHPRVQIDCWSRGDYKTAQDLADAIVGDPGNLKLDGYRGTLGGVVVQGCHLIEQRDDFESPASASDVGIYRVSLDFKVWHV